MLGRLPARAASATIAVAAAIAAAASATGTPTAAAPTRAGSASAATLAALGPWTSFVHGDGAPAKIASIQRLDGGVGLGAVGHLDEAEAAQPSAKLIANQIHFADRSVFSKSLS